jgi:hypothetical protein
MRSFLPELPDVSQPQVQLQVLVDLVELAEALYPPVDIEAVPPATAAAAGSAAAAAAGEAADSRWWSLGGSTSDSWGFNALTAQPGFNALTAQPGFNALTPGEPQLHHCSVEPAVGQLDPHQHSKSNASCSRAGTCSSSSSSSLGVAGVSEAFQAALGPSVGKDYESGSWLPVMAADVAEILQQQQAAWQQQQKQQQQEHGSSSSSSHKGFKLLLANQVGMLQFISGDVGSFLRTAVAADCVSPDVVALAAAGGGAVWAAAARLAAAKMSGKSEAAEAAAVLLKAAGDVAAAVAVGEQQQ